MLNMRAMDHIERTRSYLDYIENHLRNIEKAWGVLQEKCKDMRFIYDDYVFHEIRGHLEQHDVSKLSPEEFVQYRVKFYPTEHEDANSADFAAAWEHHKGENPHHWENWAATEFFNPYAGEVHCVCMVADWMAMGYQFGDTAREYYEKNKDRIELPEWAVRFIHEIFERVYS